MYGIFVSARRHKLESDRLAAELKNRDEQIYALERRVAETERVRHELIEEVRYLIEAGADHVGCTDSLRGEDLKTIGHVLPYLLSGRRCWDGPALQELAASEDLRARQLAADYGFRLPDDPVSAVKSMLDLAMALFKPSLSVDGLKNIYPLTSNSAVISQKF